MIPMGGIVHSQTRAPQHGVHPLAQPTIATQGQRQTQQSDQPTLTDALGLGHWELQDWLLVFTGFQALVKTVDILLGWLE